MILAIDVHYRAEEAQAVGMLFNWDSIHAIQIVNATVKDIKEYVPGEFYKRELPCLMDIINKIDLNSLEAIIVDGHVYIDNELNLGLGGKLWESLQQKVPVIGVAKTSFFRNKNTVIEVNRGKSDKPLYVSSIGMDVSLAACKVKEMAGGFRIPSLLKELDVLTKSPPPFQKLTAKI